MLWIQHWSIGYARITYDQACCNYSRPLCKRSTVTVGVDVYDTCCDRVSYDLLDTMVK